VAQKKVSIAECPLIDQRGGGWMSSVKWEDVSLFYIAKGRREPKEKKGGKRIEHGCGSGGYFIQVEKSYLRQGVGLAGHLSERGHHWKNKMQKRERKGRISGEK